MTDKPEAIPDWIKKRFQQVCEARDNGHLALVSARTIDGEQVYLLTATVKQGEDFVVVPFGHFVTPDNPYEAYQDPTVV